jgi:hypothetical protein
MNKQSRLIERNETAQIPSVRADSYGVSEAMMLRVAQLTALTRRKQIMSSTDI